MANERESLIAQHRKGLPLDERKVEALELIADNLGRIRVELMSLNRQAASAARSSSFRR